MSDIPRYSINYVSYVDNPDDGDWYKREDVDRVLAGKKKRIVLLEQTCFVTGIFPEVFIAFTRELAAKDKQIEELQHPWILMVARAPEDHHPRYFVIDQSDLPHVAYWDHSGEPQEGWWIIDGARHEQLEIIRWMESPPE